MSKFDLRLKWRSYQALTRILLTGDVYYKELEVLEAQRVHKDLEVVIVEDGEIPMTDLFASRRLVVFRDIDLLDKKTGEVFVRQVNEVDNTDLMIFMTSEKDKSPAYLKTIKFDERVEYEAIKAWEMPAWLIWAAKRHGLVLQEPHADLLVLNLGDDKTLLDLELRKMVLYKESQQAGPVITVDEIQKIFVPHQVMKPFVMLEAWGKKDYALCIRVAERIYASLGHAEETVFGWIALFLKHIEVLIQARSMLDTSMTESQIALEMGWSRNQASKMFPQIQDKTTKHLVEAYASLLALQKTIIYDTDRFQKFVFWVMTSATAGL